MGADSADVDLTSEMQAQIQEFARRLPRADFYEVLGLQRGADADEVQKAFSSRSRAFHPDRHFGKKLGPYAGLLHEIFKRVAAAYEVLRDPQLRSAYDRTLTSEDAETPGGSLRTPGARRRPEAVLAGLRRQLDLTRSKARRHYQEAMERRREGDLARAHALLRLALIFDPHEARYQNAMGEIAMSAERTGAVGEPSTDVEERT